MSIRKTLEILVLELIYPIMGKNGTLCMLFKWKVLLKYWKPCRTSFYSCYWDFTSLQGLINVLWKFYNSSFINDSTVSLYYVLKTQAWERWKCYCYYYNLHFQHCCPAQTYLIAFLGVKKTIVSLKHSFQNNLSKISENLLICFLWWTKNYECAE